MGLEVGLVVGLLSVVTGVVGGVMQANAAAESAAQQREARNISSARQRTNALEDRRARIREERIRRARILQQSQNQGTSDSSGVVGSIGALSTNLAGLIGTSLGESQANDAINNAMQRAADADARGAQIGAWTNTIQKGLSGFQSIFDK